MRSDSHIKDYQINLKSRSEFYMHRDNIIFGEGLSNWRKNPDNKNLSSKGDDRSPAWTWIGYVYTEKNKVCFPVDNFMSILRNAGAYLILKGSKTYKEATQSLITLDDSFDLIVNGEVINESDMQLLIGNTKFADHVQFAEDHGFRLDVRRAKIMNAKHIRVRPVFENWTATGKLTVLDTQIITKEILKELLEIAGTRVGVGDWRPGSPMKPGTKGRFTCELI